MTWPGHAAPIRFFEYSLLPAGQMVLLKRDGYGPLAVVWYGGINAPIEDAEFDGIGLNPVDYRALVDAIDAENAARESAPDWLKSFRQFAGGYKKI